MRADGSRVRSVFLRSGENSSTAIKDFLQLMHEISSLAPGENIDSPASYTHLYTEHISRQESPFGDITEDYNLQKPDTLFLSSRLKNYIMMKDVPIGLNSAVSYGNKYLGIFLYDCYIGEFSRFNYSVYWLKKN